jgi:hypothetical protein
VAVAWLWLLLRPDRWCLTAPPCHHWPSYTGEPSPPPIEALDSRSGPSRQGSLPIEIRPLWQGTAAQWRTPPRPRSP